MNLIEVFSEGGCESCERVIDLVTRFVDGQDIVLRVYERSADIDMFHARGVIICPATCINGKLAFYGEFATEELQQFLSNSESAYVPIATSKSKPTASWLHRFRSLIAGLIVIGALMFGGIQS